MIQNDMNTNDVGIYTHHALPKDVLKIFERIISGKEDD